MISNSKRLFIWCLTIIPMSSCGYDVQELTPQEKYTVDTLYSSQINVWRSIIDSTCNKAKDTLFIRAVDSLKKERMKEIEALLNTNTDEQ
ncbi:MAG: hypothetical protein IPL55_20640 [Saprospiraceae bacterium]|nr:hypothetical protein [Saprospiraceae bacterium]MBL0026561.1 hypothetical protein [Saprospiraceae bacterium]